MKKRTFLLFGLLAMLVLTACGGSSSSTAASASSASSGAAASGKGLSELFTYETSGREIESWNMLYSQQAIDFNVTTNIIDGLISFDNYGKPVPALAKSWEHNEDSTVWTFHLRDDVDWVDMNGEVQDHLTSKDFLVGFEWVLNAKKNQAANTSMPSTTVVGAADYYDKTYAMDDAAAEALTYDDMLAAGVGIDAPDDYTIVYTCINPCPYFDTVASYVCCYPAPPALVEKLGVEGFRGVDYTQQWCCGPYLIEEFVADNSKRFIPNPHYYAADECSRFERVSLSMITDLTVGYQLYQNRELDELELSESTLTTITSDTSNAYNDQLCEKRPTKYAYDFHFNFYCLNTDGTPNENWNKAVANRAFRRCFQEGLNLIPYYARFNKINPLKCENNYYTMKGVCYNSKGTDYVDLVAKELGIEHMDWVKVTSRRGEVHARAYLTEGVNPKTVWMERFWNPECYDASQANPTGGWRECNVNVLTKNDAPFNEVYGSYTNRGFTVKIEKSERPANIWVEAEEFEPFMPTQEMLAEAQTKDVF